MCYKPLARRCLASPEAGRGDLHRRRFALLHDVFHGDRAEHLVENGDAGWSSPVARQAHNLKVVGSNPAPATTFVITR